MSRLRSDKVVNQSGSGAPELTYGAVVPATGTISGAGSINVSGIVTAASFSGDGSGLTGVGDPSALKDGSNTKVQAVSGGADVTGNLVATGNVNGVNVSASGNVSAVDATFSGNLTVNGTTTTIDTAVISVDRLAVDGNISAGGTVTAAGIDLADDAKINLGTGDDFELYFDATYARIQSGANTMLVRSNRMEFGDNGGNKYILCVDGAQTELYHNANIRLTTTSDGVDISGTGSIKVPVGTTAQRNGSPTAGDFRYNSDEGKFEGYTTEWGEIGGGGGLTTAAHVANNAVVTLDLTAAQDHKVTATGICTITCTGGTEATSHTIRIINSGSATVGFSTFFLFPSGNTPSLPSADGAINLISFTVNRVGAAGTQLLSGASLNFS